MSAEWRGPMTIEALRRLTPDEVRTAIAQFNPRYVHDWSSWIATPPKRRPVMFGQILRNWQATRPNPMRRAANEAEHPRPYLDDLLEMATAPVAALAGLGLSWVNVRTPEQTAALSSLWEIFATLPSQGRATCVGITKAVLLATDGQIGPALDSQVQGRLRVKPPTDANGWLQLLDDVGADIRAFERQHGPLYRVVQPEFSNVADGRLYDMIFGPKSKT